MSHQIYRWPDLIDKYLNGQITENEMQELNRQKAETHWKQEHFEDVTTMKGIMGQVKALDEIKKDMGVHWQNFETKYLEPAKAVKLKIGGYGKAAITLGGLGLLALAIYFINQKRESTSLSHLPSLVMRKTPYGKDALFILADGTAIKIDSIRDGEQIADNVPYIKKNTHILPATVPDAAHTASKDVNMIYVPAGKQYQVTLPDGTDVKLNAASTFYFPTRFSRDYRWVAMNGEAFFTVTKNSNKPFYINVRNKMCAEVFGTSFNITAYDENGVIVTTLIDGKLKIGALDPSFGTVNPKQLYAGQQAYWLNGRYDTTSNVNFSQVTAWTMGKFNFKNKSIPEIMKEISRWYSRRVEFKGKIPGKTSTGVVSMSLSLSEMIDLLEESNQIHITETPDSVLIVSPQMQSINTTD